MWLNSFIQYFNYTLAFNLLAYAGVLIFTWGIPDKKRRAALWLSSGLALVAYAHYTGNQIFILTQSIMAVASFMLWWGLQGAPPLITFITGLFFLPVLLRGDINSFTVALGVAAALGLVFGVVFSGGLIGLLSFLAGGVLMILYAKLVGSGPFFWLNIIFSIFIVIELIRYSTSKNSV